MIDLHDWNYDVGGLSTAPSDRPHWVCARCDAKDFVKSKGIMPSRTQRHAWGVGAQMLSCDELMIARIMDA